MTDSTAQSEMLPVTPKDFYDLSGPALLEYCGSDASKWAQAFCRIKEAQGWSSDDIDEGLMICWFANAIEHSGMVRASMQRAEVRGVLEECANRCRYDGDLFHDQGNVSRRDASWMAADMATAALSLPRLPAPDPVAWMREWPNGEGCTFSKFKPQELGGHTLTPLYASHPAADATAGRELPSPETMLTYASILEKPQYYIHTDRKKYRLATGEIIEAACAALRYCAALHPKPPEPTSPEVKR